MADVFGFGLGVGLIWGLRPGLCDVASDGRNGAEPCRDRWNALIFASILSGRPLLGALGGEIPCMLEVCAEGAFGLRALFNRPRGVEEAVMDTLGG
jgi:hypothetical protein